MLANFEKLKKYDPEHPAWYNVTATQLHNKALKEGTNLLYIQHYLYHSKGDIDGLKENLGIRITRHSDLPLMIFNYDHVATPHDSLIGAECRGLVLEIDTWKVVAKPMYRFFNWNEIDISGALNPNFDKSQFDFKDFVSQSKEDGSLMVMYNYNGEWKLNTRTGFLNQNKKAKVIMSGIHEITCEEVISTFLKGVGSHITKL
jgi:hypothetical protein